MAAPQTLPLERYTSDAKSLVAAAQSLADERRHTQVEPIHLLARALEQRGVQEVVRKAGADPADLSAEAETQLGRIAKSGGGLAYLSNALLDLLARAQKEAAQSGVGVEQLLNAISQEIRGAAASVLQAFALGPGSFRPHMAALATAREAGAEANADAGKFTRDLVARAREATGFDPVIGRDVEVRRLLQVLERRQKNHPLLVGEPGVGKSAIVGALAMRIAAGDVPENLTKCALLELDAAALASGARLRSEIDERLKSVLRSVGGGDTILFIDAIDTLIAQGGAASGAADALKAALARGEVRVLGTTTPEGLRKINERDAGLVRRFTALTIDPPTPDQAVEILRGIATRYEAHHKVQIGDPAVVASVNLAKRYLQDRALPDTAIDLLDEAAARKRVELDGVPAKVDEAIRRLASLEAQRASLADDADAMSVKTRMRLEKEIAELSPNVTDMRKKLESRRGAMAAQNALRAEYTKLQTELESARKSQNFAKLGEIEHVSLPDAKRRLEAAEAAVKSESAEPTSNVVGEEDVALVMGDWTGIPIAKMLETEADKLLKMEARLSKRVVGQDEAVRAVSRAVRRGRVGLRDPGKPIGSFLFLGPSGVGKTELAKALAEFLFDDEQSMTRLDMSEFMEKHMAQRLVGAPPGYADSEQGGFLTEAVRRRPYSVLLFDEVEKAHADVFNLLLQVLDDGRLTDGRGRTADFSNTVVILTSNIGSKRILETDPKLFESPDGRDALRDVLLEELRNFLRPEFLNRIDDIVVFRPLDKKDLRGVLDIQLVRLEKMLGDRELKLELSEKAKAHIVDLGYEPAFGARPVKRVILKKLQDPLAENILSGGYTDKSRILVDVKDDEFTFEKMKRAHFVGVCGTGMGALAMLFQDAGWEVSGSDAAFDPPIGPVLEARGIRCMTGYSAANLELKPDLVVVGNVIRKDNPEAIFTRENKLNSQSMSSALREVFLTGRVPLIAAGTHGKTTTASMCAWILESAGLEPGFFIGGLPKNFSSGAAIGSTKRKIVGASAAPAPFVVEGDEYDAVYWHKEPKFLDYVGVSERDVAIVTSIEHDHIDIYPDAASYDLAFARFMEKIPEPGLLVCDASHARVREMAQKHAKSRFAFYGLQGDDFGDVSATWLGAPAPIDDAGMQPFDLYAGGVYAGRFAITNPGAHNVRNAVAAIAACAEGFGVTIMAARTALASFQGVKRRQDLIGEPNGVRVYDDFAHHPTAVDETLRALRSKHAQGDLWAVFEPRSATACRNLHQEAYASAFSSANHVIFAPLGRANLAPEERLDVQELVRRIGGGAQAAPSIDAILERLAREARPGDTVALLSNGSFGGLHKRLLEALSSRS